MGMVKHFLTLRLRYFKVVREDSVQMVVKGRKEVNGLVCVYVGMYICTCVKALVSSLLSSVESATECHVPVEINTHTGKTDTTL